MRDDISIRDYGNGQYVISQNNSFLFRVAIHEGKTYVSIKDIAECCGYLAGSKLVQRIEVDKIKLPTQSGDNGHNSRRSYKMWYMTVDDAVQFVRQRSETNFFREWFLEYAKELKSLSLSEEPKPKPVQQNQQATVAQPPCGVNTCIARIDQMILELVTMKQELSSLH